MPRNHCAMTIKSKQSSQFTKKIQGITAYSHNKVVISTIDVIVTVYLPRINKSRNHESWGYGVCSPTQDFKCFFFKTT